MYFVLFLSALLLTLTSASYKEIYIESACQYHNTVVFSLGSSGRLTSFIIRPNSQNEYGANIDCNVTISAANVRKGHVMFTISRIDFHPSTNCNDYIEIFRGNDVMGKLCKNFDDRRNHASYTLPRADFMKFRYHTTDSSTTRSGFELVATAYTDGPCHGDFDFRCNNVNCISSRLICDGYNNCGDDSDEARGRPSNCRLSGGVVAGIVIGTLLLIALVSGTIWCCQRRRRRVIIKTVYESPAPSVPINSGYQEFSGGMSNPTYGVMPPQPPPYKES